VGSLTELVSSLLLAGEAGNLPLNQGFVFATESEQTLLVWGDRNCGDVLAVATPRL